MKKKKEKNRYLNMFKRKGEKNRNLKIIEKKTPYSIAQNG